jgi:hypothetical protein
VTGKYIVLEVGTFNVKERFTLPKRKLIFIKVT